MLNSRLTHDAIHDYKHEPACLAAVLLKCIGGLAIVSDIAFVGATADFAPELAHAQTPTFKAEVAVSDLKD